MLMRCLFVLLIIALPVPAMPAARAALHPLRPEPGAATKAPTEDMRTRSPRQQESLDRTRRCGAEWQSLKAKGASAGKTWVEFSRDCRDRLKASGR